MIQYGNLYWTNFAFIILYAQASKLHEDRVRWNDHVFTGQQMDKSLRQVGFGKVSIAHYFHEIIWKNKNVCGNSLFQSLVIGIGDTSFVCQD